MKFLLDTNICIYAIKKQPRRVFEKLSECQIGEVGISAITYSELEYGVANSSDPQSNKIALLEFIGPLEIIDFQAGVAPVYGDLRARLKRTGAMIGSLDLLIAAHAIHLGSILVTNNTREFSRVPHLRVENWT